MNKVLAIFSFFSLLSLGFAIDSHSGSPMAQNGFPEYASTKLVGSIVKSLDGEQVGRILDLLIDSGGHVDFALILQNSIEGSPGKMVAVPFSALTISETTSRKIEVGLNVDKGTFYSAPDLKLEDLGNPQWAAGVYRYFGQQPYWTEEAVGETSTSSVE